MELQETLARLRKERGYSQAELAEELGVTRQAVSRWETGAAAPTTDNLICLSQLFGVTVDELVNGRKEVDTVPEAPPPAAVKEVPKGDSRTNVKMWHLEWKKWLIIGVLIIGIFFAIHIWGLQTNSPLAAKLLQLLIALGLLTVAAAYILCKMVIYFFFLRVRRGKDDL